MGKSAATPAATPAAAPALGFVMAEYWPLFEQWASLSQYGYVLEWFPTRQEAESNTRAFYRDRTHLLGGM